jgi:hypothetical protein
MVANIGDSDMCPQTDASLSWHHSRWDPGICVYHTADTFAEALPKLSDTELEVLVQVFDKDYGQMLKEYKIITQLMRKIMNIPGQESKYEDLDKRAERLKCEMESLGPRLEGARGAWCVRLRAVVAALQP